LRARIAVREELVAEVVQASLVRREPLQELVVGERRIARRHPLNRVSVTGCHTCKEYTGSRRQSSPNCRDYILASPDRSFLLDKSPRTTRGRQKPASS